jgi:hypothetical protein
VLLAIKLSALRHHCSGIAEEFSLILALKTPLKNHLA